MVSFGCPLPFLAVDGRGILCEAAAGGVVVLAVFATILGICISRRNRTGGNQFHHPPPQPLPVQDVSEYQKVQPVSPMLSPITTSLPYNTPASPNPPFNTLAPPNVSFPTPAGQNTPQFNPSYYVSFRILVLCARMILNRLLPEP